MATVDTLVTMTILETIFRWGTVPKVARVATVASVASVTTIAARPDFYCCQPWPVRTPLRGSFWLLIATRVHRWQSWAVVDTVDSGGHGGYAGYRSHGGHADRVNHG